MILLIGPGTDSECCTTQHQLSVLDDDGDVESLRQSPVAPQVDDYDGDDMSFTVDDEYEKVISLAVEEGTHTLFRRNHQRRHYCQGGRSRA